MCQPFSVLNVIVRKETFVYISDFAFKPTDTCKGNTVCITALGWYGRSFMPQK